MMLRTKCREICSISDHVDTDTKSLPYLRRSTHRLCSWKHIKQLWRSSVRSRVLSHVQSKARGRCRVHEDALIIPKFSSRAKYKANWAETLGTSRDILICHYSRFSIWSKICQNRSVCIYNLGFFPMHEQSDFLLPLPEIADSGLEADGKCHRFSSLLLSN